MAIDLYLAREALNYDPETGAFTWRKKIARKVVVGTACGFLHPEGYLTISLGGKRSLAHRLAWAMAHGEWPALIDHKNGDKMDNRLCNLRPADKSLNAQNMPLKSPRGSTGLRGGHMEKRTGRFIASISIRGRTIYLGAHPSAQAAHAAYVAAKPIHHPGALS